MNKKYNILHICCLSATKKKLLLFHVAQQSCSVWVISNTFLDCVLLEAYLYDWKDWKSFIIIIIVVASLCCFWDIVCARFNSVKFVYIDY